MPTCNNSETVTKQDVTCTAIAIEKLSKNVSVKTNTCNKRRAAFSVPKGYKKDKEDRLSQSSFEMPACYDVSLRADKSRDGIELRHQSY
jgi:hypothetical protein